jgi:hypothetical protein
MKQFEPTVKTIRDYTFYIRPFPAFKAANLSGELAAVILPVLSSITPMLTNTDKKNNGVLDTNIEDAAPAIAGAFSSISGDKLESLLKKLLTSNGNIAVELEPGGETQRLTDDLVNEIFCGETQDLFILAFEVIKINYAGFFGKLGSLSGSLTKLMEK